MPVPQKRLLSRKKSLVQRWSQVRRIKKRAQNGSPNIIFVKEFKPLLEEWMDEESISQNTIYTEKVRESARHGKENADFAIQNKMHQWALSRALTIVGVFSQKERRFIRMKMDFIRTASKKETDNALKGLEAELGSWRYIKFLRWYNTTINFFRKRLELLHEALK